MLLILVVIISSNDNIINSYDISDLKINISTPFSINDSNADSIKDNTYTWNLNSKDTYKDISIDFSYQQDNVYGLIMLIAIGIAVIATLVYIIRYLVRNIRL